MQRQDLQDGLAPAGTGEAGSLGPCALGSADPKPGTTFRCFLQVGSLEPGARACRYPRRLPQLRASHLCGVGRQGGGRPLESYGL